MVTTRTPQLCSAAGEGERALRLDLTDELLPLSVSA